MKSAEIRKINASFDEHSIIVYQAYNRTIAEKAVEQQNFVFDSFKASRMTWIKPSIFWMMYRSGWASKPNQEHILAVTVTREGFDWALDNACLSHFEPSIHSTVDTWRESILNSPVRIQWDPERDNQLNPIYPMRAIQLGLSGEAVRDYMRKWIVYIEDITDYCYRIKDDLNTAKYRSFLNPVAVYPTSSSISQKLGITI